MDDEKNSDSYYGNATLITGGGHWGGIADLNRTDTGWQGSFEFDSVTGSDEWIQLIARTHPSEPWPAEIQIRSTRPTTVTGAGQIVAVSGEGTSPWEND